VPLPLAHPARPALRLASGALQRRRPHRAGMSASASRRARCRSSTGALANTGRPGSGPLGGSAGLWQPGWRRPSRIAAPARTPATVGLQASAEVMRAAPVKYPVETCPDWP